MKKILFTSLIAGIFCLGQAAMANSPYSFLGPQNEGNRNFATLKQHQFEKEETLDFVNNPEQYKDKREKKEKFLDYQAGKVDVGHRQPQMNLQNSRPNSASMQFVKGEDGKIRIQGVK